MRRGGRQALSGGRQARTGVDAEIAHGCPRLPRGSPNFVQHRLGLTAGQGYAHMAATVCVVRAADDG